MEKDLNTKNIKIHPESEYGKQLKTSDISSYDDLCTNYGMIIAGIPDGHKNFC